MKKYVFALLLLLLPAAAYAGYVADQVPNLIYGSTTIKFGVDNQPSDTCAHFLRQFYFDATTESGKNMLSIMLAAKMANKKIDIWYTPSTTPGTNETNGCTPNTLAVVLQIGIK